MWFTDIKDHYIKCVRYIYLFIYIYRYGSPFHIYTCLCDIHANSFFLLVTITLSSANRCIGVWEQLSVPQGVAFRSDLSHGRLLDGNLNSTVTSAQQSVFFPWFQDASSKSFQAFRLKTRCLASLLMVKSVKYWRNYTKVMDLVGTAMEFDFGVETVPKLNLTWHPLRMCKFQLVIRNQMTEFNILSQELIYNIYNIYIYMVQAPNPQPFL